MACDHSECMAGVKLLTCNFVAAYTKRHSVGRNAAADATLST